MTSAADQYVKIGRSYTRARRFPWVIGKIQGWTIPLGPYTATQLGVLIGGLFLLVKTFDLWRRLGVGAVLVIALPFAATWAVRHAHIDGRTPLRALTGFVALLTEPQCGRINGRLARDSRPAMLTGGIRLSRLPGPLPAPHPAVQPAAVQAARPDVVQAPRPDVARAPRPDVVQATRPDVGRAAGPDVVQAPRQDVARVPQPEAELPDGASVQGGARSNSDRRSRPPRPAEPSPGRSGARPATRPAPTPLQALLAASAGKED